MNTHSTQAAGPADASAANPFAPPRANVEDAPPVVMDGPSGIAGWLLLPALGLVITPLRLLWQFVTDFAPMFRNGNWEALTTPTSPAYHAFWGPTIVFEIAINAAFLGFGLYVAWHFFSKSVKTPRLYIMLLVFQALMQVVDLALMSQIPALANDVQASDMKDLFRALIGLCIWVPYFLKSKRVRNTFIAPPPVSARASKTAD